MNDLRPIFLSASVPERDLQRYWPDPTAIADAIRALVAETVEKRVLVFGGHPAISPLVEYAARSLNAEHRVVIYQSLFFEKFIPPVAKKFQNLRWTPIVNSDKNASLENMRREMIETHPFAAGVFIGGMDGVEAEWEMFGNLRPELPRFPVASTLGAARLLWQSWVPKQSRHPDLKQRLADETDYRRLFRDLLN